MMTVDESKRELASRMGEEVSSIRTREPEWARLMKEGVIVQLHIRRWRAEHALSLEDLGIEAEGKEEQAFWSEFMSLGQKRLLPARYLRALASVDSAARACLERYSFATYWGRFVPVSSYATWKKANEEYLDRYLELARTIVDNYDELVAETIVAYRAGARAAYARLVKLGARPRVSEEAFVERLEREVRAMIRSRSEVRAGFAYETDLSYIPLPSLLAGDLAERERIDLERQRAQDEYTRENDKRWAEKMVTDHALAQRKAELEAMNRDIVASLRQQKEEQVDEFLKGVVAQLRGQVYEVVLTALESIRRNDGRLVGKSSQQLANLVETVSQLNFWGDKELSLKLAQIEQVLGPARAYGDITGCLRDLGMLCRTSLIELGESPRSGRDLGIADVAPVGELRRVRRDLGIDPDVSVLEVVRGARGWEATSA